MANLYFPQLSSGALVQFPIRKTRLARTIKNVLPDGSMILLSDPYGGHLVWELAYTELSTLDVGALQALFRACSGPFHAFTFIDPTDNMLASSSDLQAAAWQASSLIQMTPELADPDGGTAAFTLTNTGQTNQEVSQLLRVPANYQYCFSLYAMSTEPADLVLIRSGESGQQSTAFPIGPTWSRIISSGRLNDQGTSFTAAISLTAGQQVGIYGMQLEAQIAPSRYRPTTQTSGVYKNAHWAMDQLTIAAEAPNLFSTSISLETAT
jgi:hypothetical protein